MNNDIEMSVVQVHDDTTGRWAEQRVTRGYFLLWSVAVWPNTGVIVNARGAVNAQMQTTTETALYHIGALADLAGLNRDDMRTEDVAAAIDRCMTALREAEASHAAE